MLVERSDQRFARIAGYGMVAVTGLPTGVAMVAYQDCLGSTPLQLQQVAATEGNSSVAYETGAGALSFGRRDARYNRGIDVALEGLDVDAATTLRIDNTYRVNQQTVSRAGDASMTVNNLPSQAAVGLYAGSTLDVCPSTDDDAYQNAAWTVATLSTPQLRVPSMTADLLTQPDVSIVQACLAATVGTLVLLDELAPQGPAIGAVEVFVEGGAELIGTEVWTVTWSRRRTCP